MEAGSSRSGGMPQVRCSASASQNVPGVRYLQRPRSQGRQVCGSGQVNSYVSTQEGSAASLLLFCAFCPPRGPFDFLPSRRRGALSFRRPAPPLPLMRCIEIMRFTIRSPLFILDTINSLRPAIKAAMNDVENINIGDIMEWLPCGRMPFYERGCSYEHHHHHH